LNQSYFDPEKYVNDRHWHIEYDGNPSIECIAFQRKDNDSWDVFFNDFKDESEFSTLFVEPNRFRDSVFGVFLFNDEEKNVIDKFRMWVEKSLLPYRLRNN